MVVFVEVIKQFADSKLAIVGSVFTLLISLILLTWFRRRSTSPQEVFNDLSLTGTPTKSKKQLKNRSKKLKSEKGPVDQALSAHQVKSMKNVPNGNSNKVLTKLQVKDDKTPAVTSTGSAKTQVLKQDKENTKKQPKLFENAPSSPGEWTVAVSKRKPKGKKEPSPSKDIDTSNPIDLNTDVAVVTSAQVPQVKFEGYSGDDSPAAAVVSVDAIVSEEANDDKSVQLEHADSEPETTKSKLSTQLVELPAPSVGLSQDESVISTKKKQNKSKKRSTDVAERNLVKEVEKTTESTPIIEKNQTCIGQIGLVDDISDKASQKNIILTSDLPLSSELPEVSTTVESATASVDNSIQQPVLSSGVVFDELGDVATVASAQAKKKKKPRREN